MDPTSRRSFLLSPAWLAAAPAARDKTPTLRHRILGRTGLKVTELGFGSEAVSDISVFQRALDAGINFFDTARGYESGNAEAVLGAALKGKRDRVVLCTRSYAKDVQHASADLDASLKALGTDHVDVWYLGQKDNPSELKPELLDLQRKAQQAGKLRFRGVSSHRIGAVLNLVVENKIDVVQIPYSFALGTRRDPFSMDAANLDTSLDRLKSAGIGVVAMKVMAGGYRQVRINEKNADIHARTGARVAAIRWALRNDRVQTTSVRMMDSDQLLENLQSMAGTFTDADRQLLTAYTDAIRPVFCRMCGACDGRCPQGTPVADVVRAVMYAEAYGNYPQGLATYQNCAGQLPCRDCPACTVTCPNGVRVRERMHRAEELFA